MRMIDADQLIDECEELISIEWNHNVSPASWADAEEEFLQRLKDAPTIDAVEVVHGHWYVSEYEYLNCSVCGEEMYTGCNSTEEAQLLKEHWKKFCPNCGAKMDGEENGNL